MIRMFTWPNLYICWSTDFRLTFQIWRSSPTEGCTTISITVTPSWNKVIMSTVLHFLSRIWCVCLCVSREMVQWYTKRYGQWSLSQLHIVHRKPYNICVSLPRREIFAKFNYFCYQYCYLIQPILFRSSDDLCEIYDIYNGWESKKAVTLWKRNHLLWKLKWSSWSSHMFFLMKWPFVVCSQDTRYTRNFVMGVSMTSWNMEWSKQYSNGLTRNAP